MVRGNGRGHLFCLNRIILLFVAVFLGYNQYWVWVYGFVGFFLCPGASKGSIGSCSDFKASQKMGPQLKLKSHLTDWEKPKIEPVTPGLQGVGLSHIPQRFIIQLNLS